MSSYGTILAITYQGILYLIEVFLQLAVEVKKHYVKALGESKDINGSVAALRYLEQTENKKEGNRFLLEMDVQLHQPQEELVHTSEYVYLKKGTSLLCHTSNFQWRPDVDVHFVVSSTFIVSLSLHVEASSKLNLCNLKLVLL